MPVQTTAMKDILANAYHSSAAYGSVYTTAPGATQGTEPTGGSPAFARKALTWGANNAGTAVATFDIPASTTIVGAGVHSAVTAGTYYDGVGLTSQAFASQGTYQVTFTYTQS
jgi:hypothetical protein